MSPAFSIMDLRAQDSDIFVHDIISLSQQVLYAFAICVAQVCIFLVSQVGQIPHNNPEVLKSEIDSKIRSNALLRLKFTRTGKLMGKTTSNALKQRPKLPVYWTYLWQPYIQQETIMSCFVINNIARKICLEDLGRKIEAENNIKVKELHCFTKKDNMVVNLTETVLVTILWHNFPSRH